MLAWLKPRRECMRLDIFSKFDAKLSPTKQLLSSFTESCFFIV